MGLSFMILDACLILCNHVKGEVFGHWSDLLDSNI